MEDCEFNNCYSAIFTVIPDGGTAVTAKYRFLGCIFNDIGGTGAIMNIDSNKDNSIILEIANSDTRNSTISNIKTGTTINFEIGFMSVKLSCLNIKTTVGVVFNNSLAKCDYSILNCTFTDCKTTTNIFKGDINDLVITGCIFHECTTTTEFFTMNMHDFTISESSFSTCESANVFFNGNKNNCAITEANFTNIRNSSSIFNGDIGKFTLKENNFEDIPRLFNNNVISDILIEG